MSEQTNPDLNAGVAKRSKAYTPAADINLKDLALTIVASWKINPQITLVWTTQSEFETLTAGFESALSERMTTGGARPSVTRDLITLDKAIDSHTEYLKVYLKEKYGKDTFDAYLPQFGITFNGHTWAFPGDRNKRKDSLKLALDAIQAHGFADKTYGQAFWQDISTRYEALINTAVTTDGNIAGLVNTKNQHRTRIVKTLNALIHIIKGNYPDDYAAVLRTWGFQKEKY